MHIERGLTQAQLAARVGTKQPDIHRFGRGDSEPMLAFLRRLAEALGVRLEVNFVSVE